MTLYLKYRPQKISELNLESAREALQNLLSNTELPHAFLFAGPRGTGKTSSARILAKALNCEHKKKGSFEPCNKCDSCLAITKGTHIDVVEMDAASNRGIDEVRALKQDIMLAPSISPRKIYIIDEVHMLTTEAANALLKTLEEPPLHVVFILATTDPQKLPQTVISRLAIVPFHKASTKEISEKLAFIAKEEKFEVEDGVYELIAHQADGSFRDAVKILEELSISGGSITKALIESRFNGGNSGVRDLLQKVSSEGAASAIRYLETLTNNGIDGKLFLTNVISEVHQELLRNVGVAKGTPLLSESEAISFLEFLLEAKSRSAFSLNDFLPLEIAVLKFKPRVPKEPEKKAQPLPQVVKLATNAPITEPVKEIETQKADVVETTETMMPKLSVVPNEAFPDETWTKILVALRSKNGPVEALLRAAKPIAFNGTVFTVGVYFKFHKERLETPGYRIAFESVLSAVFGTTIKVEFALEEPPASARIVPSLTTPKEPDIINAAKEIFGN